MFNSDMQLLLWLVADSRAFSILRNGQFIVALNALLQDHGVDLKEGGQYEPMHPDTAKGRIAQLRVDLREVVIQHCLAAKLLYSSVNSIPGVD